MSAAKAHITRKIKELTECFTSRENVANVRKEAQEFEEIAMNFRNAHDAYHATLDNDFEIQDLQEYFECENKWIVNFQRTLEEWFSRAESEINPNDSVSNIESRSHTRTRILNRRIRVYPHRKPDRRLPVLGQLLWRKEHC